MPRVVANGIGFNTHEMGAGAPVVMLHGLLVGNLATWFFTGARAVAKTRRVLLYDLRGHGNSDRPATGYDLDTMVGDLAALLDVWQVDGPVSLVGHSYGARIALEFARRFPARVDRIAVVEAPVDEATTQDLTAFLDCSPDELIGALPEALQQAVHHGSRRGARLVAALHALAFETTMVRDVRDEPSIDWEGLGTVRAPTLLLYGARSICLPSAERLRRHLPNARLEVLDGGHYLPTECPREVTRLVADFVGAD